MRLKAAIFMTAYGLGAYAAGVYLPYRRTWVRIDPKPWPKIAYYETPTVEGWRIETSIGDRYRHYRAEFPLGIQSDRVNGIFKTLKAEVPGFKDITPLNNIDQVSIDINDGTQWRDVDGPLADALAKIKKNPDLNFIRNDPALTRAVKSWSKALGREVPTPVVYRGDCHAFMPFAVACAHDGYIVVQNFYSTDPFSIYLHEIGHLMGVQHIPGDRLMEADYTGPVTGPTKAAIAAALHPKVD